MPRRSVPTNLGRAGDGNRVRLTDPFLRTKRYRYWVLSVEIALALAGGMALVVLAATLSAMNLSALVAYLLVLGILTFVANIAVWVFWGDRLRRDGWKW